MQWAARRTCVGELLHEGTGPAAKGRCKRDLIQRTRRGVLKERRFTEIVECRRALRENELG